LGGDEAQRSVVSTTVVGTAADTSGGAATSAGGSGPATSGELNAGTPVAVPSMQPKIVRTADMRIRVRGSFTAAMDQATAVASLFGGYVTSSSTSSLERGSSSAVLTLRVPADRFDEARQRITKLGKLQSLEMSSQDVGGQLVDLDARLRAARAEEAALSALLGKAGDIGQILQVRDRIAAVRTEIEQLDGQQAALRDQVAMSTIHVSLDQSGTPVTKTTKHGDGRDATSIGDSARTALHAAEAVIGGMLIVLGVMSPLLALALLGWLVWWVVARRRRPVVQQ
jgi:hypothetical protein